MMQWVYVNFPDSQRGNTSAVHKETQWRQLQTIFTIAEYLTLVQVTSALAKLLDTEYIIS